MQSSTRTRRALMAVLTAGCAAFASVAGTAHAQAEPAGGHDAAAPRPGGNGPSNPPPPDRIWFAGKYIYLNGVNVPWGTGTFGTDIGCDYNPAAFETMFDNLQAYGVNAVRFWVHVDGRCSPTFTADDSVSGVPAHFWADLDDFLARARKHDIAVLLVLWAPDMTITSSAYESVRPAHTDLITDPALTATYIRNVLIPMARRYDDDPALLGYEVMNEPEFATDSSAVWGTGSYGPGDRDTVPLTDIQRFIAQQVVALHENTRKDVVAAGSAAYKWLSDTGAPNTVGNWWSDAALQAVVPPNERRYAYSNFYEVHWYPWEQGTGYSFSPWQPGGPAYYNTGGKPVIIGELPAADDTDYTRQQKVDETYTDGYAGAMFWSYNGIDDYGSWNDIKDLLLAFRNAHPDQVDLDLNSAPRGD